MEKISGKGFVPVMLTPFKENGNVDFDGLTRLTEFYLQAGAKGLFANCQSSEMYSLSPDEKIQIIQLVTQTAGGKVPVVAVGNFGSSLQEQASFVKRVYETTGVAAVILVTSLISPREESDEVFEQKVFKLLELTENIPVGFYECPVPYKRVLPPNQLKKFVATGRVIYHKDTCLDINQVKEKLNVTHDYNQFGLYDAFAVNAVESLKSGAAGLSCIQGNFFPELIVWLCNNYDDMTKQGKTGLLQDFLVRNMEVMHYAYPSVAKIFLKKRGLPISSYTRTETETVCDISVGKLDLLYNEYLQLKDVIAD